MHWYKKNIGDYAKKTQRLNLLQHGAYNQLMDACYDRERFPTLEEAIDWLWAANDDEIAAVKYVLNRFFVLQDGVYYHSRIAEEIEAYHAKADKNKQIASESWAKRKESDANRIRNASEKVSVVCERIPNQELVTNNQELLTNKQQTSNPPTPPDGGGERRAKKTSLADDFEPKPEVREFAEQMDSDYELQLICFKNDALAHDRQYTNWNAAFRKWLANPLNKRKPVNGNHNGNHNGNKTIQQQRFEANNYIFNRGRNVGAGGRTIDAPDEDSVRRQIESKLPF